LGGATLLRKSQYMSISDKTRKKLWAKSGNRCAICKSELFSKEEGGESLNIGEECHIISKKPKGPRHVKGLADYDEYENLILLCRNHHKEIDTLTESFPEEVLRYMKLNHDNWVKNRLDSSLGEPEYEEPKFLRKVSSGKDLMHMLTDCHGYRADYDEQDSSLENEYIGGVLQSLTDYGDLLSMGIEQYEKVNIASQLKEFLEDMEHHGYFLFAEKKVTTVKYDGDKLDNWHVATLLVKSADNKEIISL
jgi:hypothetical protein